MGGGLLQGGCLLERVRYAIHGHRGVCSGDYSTSFDRGAFAREITVPALTGGIAREITVLGVSLLGRLRYSPSRGTLAPNRGCCWRCARTPRWRVRRISLRWQPCSPYRSCTCRSPGDRFPFVKWFLRHFYPIKYADILDRTCDF